MAILTLIINATTTGCLVRKLGLTKESDIQKNILYGIAVKIQTDTEDTIEILKTKRHYNNVDWQELRNHVQMEGIKKRLEQFKKLNIMETTSDNPEAILNNLEHLQNLNERFKEAEMELEAQKKEEESDVKKQVPGLENLNNLDKMYNPNLTFKGYRRKKGGNNGMA